MKTLQNKIVPTELMLHHIRETNVAILAFSRIMTKAIKESITDQMFLEDMKGNLEIFLYDLECIDLSLSESMNDLMESIKYLDVSDNVTIPYSITVGYFEEFINSQTVSLLALRAIQNNENKYALMCDTKEGFLEALEPFMFQVSTIFNSMNSNMGELIEIKAELQKQKNKTPTFSFTQNPLHPMDLEN